MRILITGFAGFIGSHLTEAMVKLGHQVYGLDDFSSGNIWKVRDILDCRNFKYKKGDIRDKDLVYDMMRDMDVVFHLAAQIHVDKSYVEPELTYDVNVKGTQNILEAAKWHDVRVIYASSSEVYGSAMNGPIDEHHELNAPHPYGASKIAADRMCYAYAKTYNMNIRIMRFFNIFGPRQADEGYGGVISKFIRLMMAGKTVPIYGDGSQTRDYTFIDDAIDAYKLALNTTPDPDSFVINIGTGKEVVINKIVEELSLSLQCKSVHIEPRIGEVERLICNPALAKQVLGWEPKISFSEGLNELVECINKVIDYVFYRSERIGRWGKPFTLWKFRSMSRPIGIICKFSVSSDDPRITRIGKYLRKYKIDELPQIINIIKGDMAIVGPRPEVRHYVDMLTEEQRAIILSVKPGLTDYASILFKNEAHLLAGHKNAEKYYENNIRPIKTRLQMRYVKEKSLWVDIKIIFQTIMVLIK